MKTFRNYLSLILKDYPGGQKALAAEAGISGGILSRIVNGEITPEPGRVTALSQALPTEQGLQLIRHYLRALTPDWAQDLIDIRTKTESVTLREEPASYKTPDEELDIAMTTLRTKATTDQSTREWLIHTADLLKG